MPYSVLLPLTLALLAQATATHHTTPSPFSTLPTTNPIYPPSTTSILPNISARTTRTHPRRQAPHRRLCTPCIKSTQCLSQLCRNGRCVHRNRRTICPSMYPKRPDCATCKHSFQCHSTHCVRHRCAHSIQARRRCSHRLSALCARCRWSAQCHPRFMCLRGRCVKSIRQLRNTCLHPHHHHRRRRRRRHRRRHQRRRANVQRGYPMHRKRKMPCAYAEKNKHNTRNRHCRHLRRNHRRKLNKRADRRRRRRYSQTKRQSKRQSKYHHRQVKRQNKRHHRQAKRQSKRQHRQAKRQSKRQHRQAKRQSKRHRRHAKHPRRPRAHKRRQHRRRRRRYQKVRAHRSRNSPRHLRRNHDARGHRIRHHTRHTHGKRNGIHPFSSSHGVPLCGKCSKMRDCIAPLDCVHGQCAQNETHGIQVCQQEPLVLSPSHSPTERSRARPICAPCSRDADCAHGICVTGACVPLRVALSKDKSDNVDVTVSNSPKSTLRNEGSVDDMKTSHSNLLVRSRRSGEVSFIAAHCAEQLACSPCTSIAQCGGGVCVQGRCAALGKRASPTCDDRGECQRCESSRQCASRRCVRGKCVGWQSISMIKCGKQRKS